MNAPPSWRKPPASGSGLADVARERAGEFADTARTQVKERAQPLALTSVLRITLRANDR